MISVSGPRFITQFPYKSCQRSNTPRKVTGHHWPHNKPPDTVPKRRVSLKRKKYAGNMSYILTQLVGGVQGGIQVLMLVRTEVM